MKIQIVNVKSLGKNSIKYATTMNTHRNKY